MPAAARRPGSRAASSDAMARAGGMRVDRPTRELGARAQLACAHITTCAARPSVRPHCAARAAATGTLLCALGPAPARLALAA